MRAQLTRRMAEMSEKQIFDKVAELIAVQMGISPTRSRSRPACWKI